MANLPRLDIGEFVAATDAFGMLPRFLVTGDPPLDFTLTASGGALGGGSATVSDSLAFTASGGARVGGAADVAGEPLLHEASGGALVGGTAPVIVSSLFVASGGAVGSGAAEEEFFSPAIYGTLDSALPCPAAEILMSRTAGLDSSLPLTLASDIRVLCGAVVQIDSRIDGLLSALEVGGASALESTLPVVGSAIAVLSGVSAAVSSVLAASVNSAIEVQSGAGLRIQSALPLVSSSLSVLSGANGVMNEVLPFRLTSALSIASGSGGSIAAPLPGIASAIAVHRIVDVQINARLPGIDAGMHGRRIAA